MKSQSRSFIKSTIARVDLKLITLNFILSIFTKHNILFYLYKQGQVIHKKTTPKQPGFWTNNKNSVHENIFKFLSKII